MSWRNVHHPSGDLHASITRAPEFLPFVKELPKETTSQKKANANKGSKQKVVAAATEAVTTVTDKLKEAAV